MVVVAAVAAVEVAMGLVERAKRVGTEVVLVPLVVVAAEAAQERRKKSSRSTSATRRS